MSNRIETAVANADAIAAYHRRTIGRLIVRADATVRYGSDAATSFRAYVERAGGRIVREVEDGEDLVHLTAEIPWTDEATTRRLAAEFEAAFGSGSSRQSA